MKLTLAADEVKAVAPPAKGSGTTKAAAPAAGTKSATGGGATGDPAGLEVAVQTTDNTCDLRGLRTEDAVSLAITFLDRSLNENQRVCFILHGHGTGAIKEAIRRELKSSPYVRYFRAGQAGEGGDGVTVAWLS